VTFANPFDQLIRLSKGRRVKPRMPAPAPAQRQVTGTKVATLIDYLREAGPASTATLRGLIGLESTNLVWGLLRAPLERGEVHYADGYWSASETYDEERRAELRAAAQMLRRAGWSVREPAR
jgi:hypothetical protein